MVNRGQQYTGAVIPPYGPLNTSGYAEKVFRRGLAYREWPQLRAQLVYSGLVALPWQRLSR